MADDRAVPPAFLPVGLLLQSALRKQEPEPAPLPEGVDITIEGAEDGSRIDPVTGALMIEEDDGSVIIDFNPKPVREDRPSKFNDNLAEVIDSAELGRIAGDILRGIQFDDASRTEWLETRAQGIRILGLKIDPPRTSIDTTASLDGMSNVRHPMLLEATLRFQANARGELLPSDGPVKVADKLLQTGETNKQAEQLEKDFNYYLTSIATEYYPDTDRLLLFVGFGGCMFKKVFYCPLRQRPVSESVDAKDLIVSNAATDMRNSGRVTHQITMRPSVLRRMQLAGAYRDVPISAPAGVVQNPVDQQIAETQGVNMVAQQTEDRDHTIYETYCELDIAGFEHKIRGKPTGLPLPYRVVIEKDSQQVLEVRRNWAEDDETMTAKVPFVKYPFVPGLGFYDIGLIHILGNTTNALTAAWREMLDAGMFANFPGFLYSKPFGRQNTNEFRVPPGGGAPIDTNGEAISNVVMPLPYKDISPAFAQFVTQIAETGQRVGGTAEVQVAEGRQDAPVGTTLALIEQATKVEGAVHKRLHAAQAEEFQLLKECFREHPESFVKAMRKKGHTLWNEENFLKALNDASIVPMADPNTPSHMHRLMKGMALIQLMQAFQGLMNPQEVLERVLNMIGVDDIDQIMMPQTGAPPGMPPEMIVKLKEVEAKAAEQANKIELQRMADAAEARQQQHEARLQQNESRDQMMQAQVQREIAMLDFRASNRDAEAGLAEERIKHATVIAQNQTDEEVARINAEADKKVAEHGVKVAQHGVAEAKQKAAGDAAKARAAAKRPATKPAAKN